jgi:hypothetical protein
MIQSFGLHWRLDRVDWGRPRVAGTLLGAASRSPRARSVDFREQRGIYALYALYDLVYVGQTGAGTDRLFRRLKSHKFDHLADRWDRFSWFGTQWVTKTNDLSRDTASLSNTVEAALNILEAVSIALSEPRLNLQRGKWGEATQYFQSWDRSKAPAEADEEED